MTIRDIPDEVIRRLEERATSTGQSCEAEARKILADSLTPEQEWAAFEAAVGLLREGFAGRRFNNSVDDLSDIRADRYGRPEGQPE
ncbi:FitA-like ribbon-helix-helix domain-containing protein [Azospirillum sp. sgz302134]